jgi:hypothetical protein
MCVESSQNTIEISNYLYNVESLNTLLNKFCKKGLNPLIFSQLRERSGLAPYPFRVD